MKAQILQVKNLEAGYKSTNPLRKKETRKVLQGISFCMQEGEILGLVGESGSGKSTTAKIVAGLLSDYTGEVILASPPQMIFQDPFGSLNPCKKVGWIVQEPLRIQGGYTKEERTRGMFEMLAKVGLGSEIAERYPRQLSGGQRQRVCIAAALMLRPSLLIADEPVSALDVLIQKQVMELLVGLQKEFGLSMLFISHDLRLVHRVCDRVLVLRDGRIV